MRSQKPILLVEDDKVDAMTIKRAFNELNIRNELVNVKNGEEALAYLRNPNNIAPCIILLDLNMPRMNGIDFLNNSKKDGLLERVPVVILTTSKEEQDRFETFKLGVAGYMVKPVDYIQFVEVIRAIDLYWTISELPE